jgi:hypothetical protein
MKVHQDIRPLSQLELNAVCGGVTEGGCILPIKIVVLPVPGGDWVFVDQFASRLPSWVQPR